MTIAASPSDILAAGVDDLPEGHRSLLQRALIFCRRQPLGTFGLVLVVIMAIAGLFAEWIAPYSPTANDFSPLPEPPSRAHWLGTDQFRRALPPPIIYGSPPALLV